MKIEAELQRPAFPTWRLGTRESYEALERISVKCGVPRHSIHSVEPLFERDTSVRHALGENLPNNMSVDVSQSKISATVTIGQPFMIDAQQMQNRRLQIVNVDRSLHDSVTKIIRATVNMPSLDSTTCEPH